MTFAFWLKVAEQALIFGVMALGVHMTYKILDFPDLTVDGSFPLGAATVSAGIVAGINPFAATLLAVAMGAISGIVTGVIHVKLGVTNLLSGILVMTGLYSINLRLMGRANLPLFGSPTIFSGSNLLVILLTAIAIKVLLDLFLNTRTGLLLRATGDNSAMVASLGVDVGTTKIIGLAFSNGIVALAGAMLAQYQGFADVGMGQGIILMGLAAIILGNALFAKLPLQATTITLAGTLLYRASVAGAINLGFAPTDLKLITALLVIIAISVPQLKGKTQLREEGTTIAANPKFVQKLFQGR